MKLTSLNFCCALLGMTASTLAVYADENLNCDAYADAAVVQQRQNIALGCGYGGGTWSADYNAHRSWCLKRDVHMADLTSEDSARAGALKICVSKTDACNTYASVALEQSRYNNANGCGFTGGRWSPDVNGHRAWCMAVPPEASLAEMDVRAASMHTCKSQKGEGGELAKLNLQNSIQGQQQALRMLSNISKLIHDSNMSVIRKIGG